MEFCILLISGHYNKPPLLLGEIHTNIRSRAVLIFCDPLLLYLLLICNLSQRVAILYLFLFCDPSQRVAILYLLLICDPSQRVTILYLLLICDPSQRVFTLYLLLKRPLTSAMVADVKLNEVSYLGMANLTSLLNLNVIRQQ